MPTTISHDALDTAINRDINMQKVGDKDSYQNLLHQALPHQILTGTTWHVRHLPSKHKFSYPYRYWGLSLNRLAAGDFPDKLGKAWDNLHRFDFADYFQLEKLDETHCENAQSSKNGAKAQLKPSYNQPLSQNVATDKQLQAQLWQHKVLQQFKLLTDSEPTGDILALVVSRNLGFYFSPVNFYIGFDDKGDASHLLAEISNTPWDKRHFYGFKLDGNTSEFSHNKGFHVSPFNPLNQKYSWKVKVVDNPMGLKQITLSIEVSDSRGKVFVAGINMKPQAMTTANITKTLTKNPVMNYSSMGRIYWHAFLIYALKKVPYVGYNQLLKDSKQGDSKHGSSSFASLQNNDQIKEPKMPTQSNHPTDRKTQSLVNRVAGSPALTPVKLSIDVVSRRVLFKALSYLQFGSITVIENQGSNKTSKNQKTFTFGSKPQKLNPNFSGELAGNHALHATLEVHNKDFYRKLITGGDIALADSYINGEWEVDDLTALIRLGARNKGVSHKLDGKLSKLTKTFEFKKHKSRSNTVSNSKSNILAHYDLGNDMYQSFLDDTMMYSSAIYPTPDATLYEAQQNKLKILCELLELKSDDHVIEIGTGWGGFAIYAATHYGCQVTTTTISDAQYEEAKRRVEQAGLSGKITLLKQDYRNLEGQYDKLISIEMVEAVGHEYLPTFFAKCNSLLKPNGIMALQAITFNDQGYEKYLNSADFIQSHIFPGGCLLSNQEITQQFTQQTDMVVKSLIDYGYDYAQTLRDWRHAFMAHLEDIRAMGYDEAFIRLWQFYFCYCEAGFLERTIGVVQVKAVKPDNR